MSARLITVPRPDEQVEASWMVRHKCPQGNALLDYLDEPDLLLFPIGTYGADMPSNVPFEVRSQEPCAACGKRLRIWAQWAGPRIFLPT